LGAKLAFDAARGLYESRASSMNSLTLEQRDEAFSTALRLLRTARKVEPSNAEIPFTLAAIYFDEGDNATSSKWAAETLRIDPKHEQALALERRLAERSETAVP
jgi:tetratricopeptide (TPR) repeat protein